MSTLFERMAERQTDDPDPIIRVVDFECTGLHDGAEVCEVGYTDLNARTRQIGPTVSYLCRVASMPPDTRAVHHIRAEETWGSPPYDRRCLYEEAARAGVYAWAAHSAEHEQKYMMGAVPMFCTNKIALRLWPDAPKHSVFGLLYWLEDRGFTNFERDRAFPPHRAGADSYATAVLVRAMLEEGVTGNTMREWSSEPRVFPRCPIGQYRDRPWSEVDWGFLDWILRKIDDPDIRFNATLEQERRRHADA